MNASAARLARISAQLRAGEHVPKDDATMLANAFDDFLERGIKLDDALDLKVKPGERTFATQCRIEQSDGYLRECAGAIFPDLKPAAQAREISREMHRYEAAGWLRDRAAERCPPRYSGKIQFYLWNALQARPRALSAEHIRRILCTSSTYS
jgi:hypothetical protein